MDGQTLTAVEVATQVFGGAAVVAGVAGVDVAEVKRWQRLRGEIPHECMKPLLKGAARRGKALTLGGLCFGRPLPQAYQPDQPVETVPPLERIARYFVRLLP